jgi:hypothetical protein
MTALLLYESLISVRYWCGPSCTGAASAAAAAWAVQHSNRRGRPTIPGVIFSGGWNWVLHVATSDGTLLWTFDMLGNFETVNGVPARGAPWILQSLRLLEAWSFAGPVYPLIQNGPNGNVPLAVALKSARITSQWASQ